jgi:electron transfer flavoprotein beta subunit
MKIIVPVKQVPESSNVKMDSETGTVIRAGVETVVNPLDLYAIEVALRIKAETGGEVTALSMGPPPAIKALKEAVAMGCDKAVLVSDRQFGGADTHATSYTLAQAIRKLGGFDLLITGERATDGDTAQVGPGIAAWLDIPVASYVSKINSITDGVLNAERLVEEGYQIFSLGLPCLISVVKAVATPRLPTLRGKIRSMELKPETFNAENMELQTEYLGLKGSPTRVVKIESPKIIRHSDSISVNDDISLNRAVDALMDLLEKKGVLP